MHRNIICIYHGNCADGFTAAWIVNKYYKQANRYVEFYPGVYQQDPPDVTGKTVIMVDFSYKRPVMEKLIQQASGVIWLDHHGTAGKDLDGLDFMDFVFDTTRSGAGIAWDYFFEGVPRPTLVDMVEDRDLWKFKIPKTREVAAAMFSYPYTFENWDKMMNMTDLDLLVREGEAIERKHFKDIAELCDVTARFMRIGGHSLHVANIPYTMSSDACRYLFQKWNEPFGACYWDTHNGRVFSLRSDNDGPDVSQIALQYGGGGHPHAAGFSVPWGHELTK